MTFVSVVFVENDPSGKVFMTKECSFGAPHPQRMKIIGAAGRA